MRTTYEYKTGGEPFYYAQLDTLVDELRNTGQDPQRREIERRLQLLECEEEVLHALNAPGVFKGFFVHGLEERHDFYFQFFHGLSDGHGMLDVFIPNPWDNPLNQLTLEGARLAVDRLAAHKGHFPGLLPSLVDELKGDPAACPLSAADTAELVAYLLTH